MEKISRIGALVEFFGLRTTEEKKEILKLSTEEREELATLSAAALGKEIG